MKWQNRVLKVVVGLAVVLGLGLAWAADDNRPRRGRREGPPPDGAQRPGAGQAGRRHPRAPLVLALDANKDGEISAEEIANAPAALKTLDKNGDGKLTRDEIRPPDAPRGGRRGGQGGDALGEGNGPGRRGPGGRGRRGGPGGGGDQQAPPPDDGI
jgi:hypothetical protein